MTIFNPKFLEKNFINDVSQLTDSGTAGDNSKIRLFDRNDEIKHATIGDTAGSRTFTFTLDAAKTVNRIWIQGCNFEDFTIKYNTSNDFSPAISLTGNDKGNLYFEISDQALVSTDTIDIDVTKVFDDVAEPASMTEWYVGAELFEIDKDTIAGEYEPRANVSQRIFPLSDGSTNKLYIRKILNWLISLQNVSEADRQNFIDLFERNRRETFVFIARPRTLSDTWDGLADHYNWVNAEELFNWTDRLFVNGFDINIDLRKAGGID